MGDAVAVCPVLGIARLSKMLLLKIGGYFDFHVCLCTCVCVCVCFSLCEWVDTYGCIFGSQPWVWCHCSEAVHLCVCVRVCEPVTVVWVFLHGSPLYSLRWGLAGQLALGVFCPPSIWIIHRPPCSADINMGSGDLKASLNVYTTRAFLAETSL